MTDLIKFIWSSLMIVGSFMLAMHFLFALRALMSHLIKDHRYLSELEKALEIERNER